MHPTPPRRLSRASLDARNQARVSHAARQPLPAAARAPPPATPRPAGASSPAMPARRFPASPPVAAATPSPDATRGSGSRLRGSAARRPRPASRTAHAFRTTPSKTRTSCVKPLQRTCACMCRTPPEDAARPDVNSILAKYSNRPPFFLSARATRAIPFRNSHELTAARVVSVMTCLGGFTRASSSNVLAVSLARRGPHTGHVRFLQPTTTPRTDHPRGHRVENAAASCRTSSAKVTLGSLPGGCR